MRLLVSTYILKPESLSPEDSDLSFRQCVTAGGTVPTGFFCFFPLEPSHEHTSKRSPSKRAIKVTALMAQNAGVEPPAGRAANDAPQIVFSSCVDQSAPPTISCSNGFG